MFVEAPEPKSIRVLFVCLGNICRSPLAEGVFRDHLEKANYRDDISIEVDSAGTGSWHVGDKPDARMRATSRMHGVSLEDIRARQFVAEDFSKFDHIYAMDRQNQKDILSLANSEADRKKVRLFRSHDPDADDLDVPDPYYGGESGFQNVFTIVERTIRQIVDDLLSSE